jgi:ATP-dependent Clp protease ATP-binding subunit ClpC
MMLTVPIYQRKVDGSLSWTTLGLGPLTQTASGRTQLNAQRALVDALKKLAPTLEPAALSQLRVPRSPSLERLRLDLNLSGADGKRKVTGTYPLVLEPRWINAETRIFCVYHPERQLEWFPLPDGEEGSLPERARLFFREAWAELGDAELEALTTDSKDTLRSLSLDLRLPALLDRLPERSGGIWDDLDPDLFRPGKRKRKQQGFKVLRRLGVDQTLRAADQGLALGMPRQPYRRQLEVALGGQSRRPTLLVGPPQCGKSTLLARFIADLLASEGFATHRNFDRVTHVWAIAGQRIIAGMTYLGDWEQRCLDLLDDASRPRVVLLCEDLHAFGRLGRTRDSDRNLAELFRAPLARGEITLVGECTPEQLARLEDDAPSFAALFSPIYVQPAATGETLRMLVHEARALERSAPLAIDPLIHQPILELTDSLFPQAAFPGKALELLRELARREEDRAGEGESARPVGSAQLIEGLSAKTGLPRELLAPSEPLTRDALMSSLEQHVMGQRVAVESACDLVLRIRAGLTDPRRPYGVYLFTGPTGTGKTELCKCIAELLYGDAGSSRQRLLRFDMGEFAGPDAAARLCGDRYAPRGLLTEQVRQQPFCVVLLDEIEKAHPTVLNLLLQLFDEGRLTDAAGTTADFTHAVLIMTSNLGARDRAQVGFAEADGAQAVLGEVAQAVREFFPPELYNRIDRVVPFGPLDRDSARRIARKELASLLARRGLVERNVFVTPTEQVLERIVDRGFDPLYGARTVKRYLEREISALLADRIAGEAPAAMRQLSLYAPTSAEVAARGEAGLDASESEPAQPFAVHLESLVEAEATAEDLPLEPLLSEPVSALRARLPTTLDELDALLDDATFERLTERMRFHLQRHVSGARGHADTLFNLDSLRGQLRGLRGRIGYMQVKKRGDRQQILDSLAEVRFLQRALGCIEDPAEHAVLIELRHVGLVRRSARFRQRGSALLPELVRAYSELARHGEVESWASRAVDGRRRHGEGPPSIDPAEGVEQLVLSIVGLGVRDFYAGERGCHLWRSLAQGSDVLRVDVWSPASSEGGATSDTEDTSTANARQVLDRRELAAKRFRQALESGDAVPRNPAGLLPLVRQYGFDPPREATLSAALELEDYALGYAGTQRVRCIAEGLPQLWLLRQSRDATSTTPPPPDEPGEPGKPGESDEPGPDHREVSR